MRAAIVSFPGSSSAESVHALQEVGFAVGDTAAQASAEALQGSMRADLIWHTATDLSTYDVIILPGGFSYGDYLRSGAIASRTPIVQALRAADEAGTLILGIGNGFQVLTEAGLLPGVLMQNTSLKFHCNLSNIVVNNHRTPFTNGYQQHERITLPIAHESGHYYCDNDTLRQLQSNRQIVFTYEGDNPNGSIANIAGITNEQGNVLGMMPRPERAMHHLFGTADGKRLFASLLASWKERQDTATNAN